MKKRIIFILPIFIMIFSLITGCTKKSTEGEVTENFIEIVDMAGRNVTIPAKVDTIFSTGPVGTILIYSLNPDKMVGWNYELREGEKRYIDEKYHDLPNLGGAGKESINVEELIKVDPDVLIAMGTIDDTFISQTDELQEKIGKSIVILDGDIYKLDETYKLLGEIMNEEEKSKQLGKYCKDTLEDIEKKSIKVTEDMKVSIYYAEGPNGLETEPSGSRHVYVIDIVGGNNVAEVEIKGDRGKSEVSIEQLLLWDPEIIISWDDERGGYYSGILKDPAWKDIKAVKDGEVYEIPNKPFNWFDRPPSVNRILGLKWIGNLLYPDIYDYDMRKEVKEFYDKFYHYSLTEYELDELLQNSIRH
ncbi:iron complex transport system substrate-binding protein [Keratinibaculum paraultunense]|uniref:Iron complex transport system substrate-binding protein n=1 Tax=Keratinibaculum paraultunense TaxID=1278232 RepID=A0A4R3L104_9FIRM|nr:ABC transporter substrate-binding protein [Keratinibaculum paraultunense]QQY79958.1 ABC transporter substrate-binding protein [Keratinibaculum paraultunense]TCS91721.1 iron complex transport system substrate-binding protein [Keratinibaculum paraultunense]